MRVYSFGLDLANWDFSGEILGKSTDDAGMSTLAASLACSRRNMCLTVSIYWQPTEGHRLRTDCGGPPCPPLTRHLICMEKSHLLQARAGELAGESPWPSAKRERRSTARAGARGFRGAPRNARYLGLSSGWQAHPPPKVGSPPPVSFIDPDYNKKRECVSRN